MSEDNGRPYITFGSEKHHMEELLRPRPLTRWEEAVIERIVDCTTTDREALRGQLRTVAVVGECRHCPTAWLNVDRAYSQALRSASGEPRFGTVNCELEGKDLDGMPISILLHLNRGFVSELDVFRGDSEPLLAVPQPEALEIICRGDASTG